MTKRALAIALCLVAVVLGIGGYLVISPLPILGGVGFFALVATTILFALGPDRSWSRAEDIRRAHEHQEHPMPEGPAPPFQTSSSRGSDSPPLLAAAPGRLDGP